MAMDFSKSKNATNLKKIQQKSVENSNNIVAIDIPLDQIDKNEDNERIFSMSDIEYLADGIKTEGFFGAIEVYRKPDGRYEISAGHRRYEAMKYLKRKTIPCIVKEIPDDITRGKKLLSSNLRNRKLTNMDMARALEYYKTLLESSGQGKDFRNQAASFFNMSGVQVYRYHCLVSLIPELQELADKEGFPFSSLQGAVNLKEEGQKELYKQIMLVLDGDISDEKTISRTRVESIIESIRGKQEYQKNPKKEETRKKNRERKVLKEKVIPNKEIEGIAELHESLKVYGDDNKTRIEYYEDNNWNNNNDIALWSGIDVVRGILNGVKILDKDKAKEYVKVLKDIIKEIEEKSS